MARLRDEYLTDLLKYNPADISEKIKGLRQLTEEEITAWLVNPKILGEMNEAYERSIAETYKKIVEAAQQVQEFADNPTLFEKRFGFSVTKDQLAALKGKASKSDLVVDKKPLDVLEARTAKPVPPVSPVAPPSPVK